MDYLRHCATQGGARRCSMRFVKVTRCADVGCAALPQPRSSSMPTACTRAVSDVLFLAMPASDCIPNFGVSTRQRAQICWCFSHLAWGCPPLTCRSDLLDGRL